MIVHLPRLILKSECQHEDKKCDIFQNKDVEIKLTTTKKRRNYLLVQKGSQKVIVQWQLEGFADDPSFFGG